MQLAELLEHGLVELLLAEQALAQHEVGVRQRRQRLEQDLGRRLCAEARRVELVQLEQGQVGLQVVAPGVRAGIGAGLLGLEEENDTKGWIIERERFTQK